MEESPPVPPPAVRPFPPTRPATPKRKFQWVWVTRPLTSLILVVAMLSVSYGVFEKLTNSKQPPPRDEPAPTVLAVEVFAVERADLKHFVTGFGTAWADREVVVSAEVAGRVTEVDNLKIGRDIRGPSVSSGGDGGSVQRQGDLICQIDPQTYEQRLQQVAALLEQDRISEKLLEQQHATNQELFAQQQRRLQTAEAELLRQENLMKQGAGMAGTRDRAKQETEQYRESLIRLQNEMRQHPVRVSEVQSRKLSHESDLRLAQIELEKATVRAPFSGQLSKVFVEEGQYVRPGDQLVQVTDHDRIEIPIPLPITAVAELEKLIRAGQPPVVELCRREEDFRDPVAPRWHGRAVRIAPIADQRTRTVSVYVEVINDQQLIPLRPGTFLHGRVQSGVVQGAAGVLVPREAIVDGAVYVAAGQAEDAETASEHSLMRAEQRPVEIAGYLQSFALVTAGIQEGDLVVMSNLDIIQPDVHLDVRHQIGLNDELKRLRIPSLERIEEAAVVIPLGETLERP